MAATPLLLALPGALAYLAGVAAFVLAIWDGNRLSKTVGIEVPGAAVFATLFLPPVYLLVRARHVVGTWAIPITWFATFIVGVAVRSTLAV